jgi:hypothetical protein
MRQTAGACLGLRLADVGVYLTEGTWKRAEGRKAGASGAFYCHFDDGFDSYALYAEARGATCMRRGRMDRQCYSYQSD